MGYVIGWLVSVKLLQVLHNAFIVTRAFVKSIALGAFLVYEQADCSDTNKDRETSFFKGNFKVIA